MFVQILVALLVTSGALSEEATRLRGSGFSVKHNSDPFSNQETLLKRQEKHLGDYLNHLYQIEGKKVEPGKDVVSGKPSPEALEYYGSNTNDQLTYLNYENFIISRQCKKDDCTGEVVSVVGKNLNCRPIGDSRSVQYECSSDRGSTVMFGYMYEGRSCEGEPIGTMSEPVYPCNEGVKMNCVRKERTHAFANKDGLITYKFNSYNDCADFSYQYLGTYPGYTNDDAAVAFDDFYIDSSVCCSEMDIQNGCPYPLCVGGEGEGGGGGGGMTPSALAAHRSREASHRATAALHTAHTPAAEGATALSKAAAKADHPLTTITTAAAASELSADQLAARRAWWRKQAMEHRAAFGATPTAAAVGHTTTTTTTTSAAAADTATTTELDALFAPAPVATAPHQASDKQALYVAPFREYAFTQLRNKVCTYDEKYELWVKTSCHTKSGTLVYFIFADPQCTRAIKRVVHSLPDAVPQYGQCIPSIHGDQRVMLTICHNDVEPQEDMYAPPPPPPSPALE